MIQRDKTVIVVKALFALAIRLLNGICFSYEQSERFLLPFVYRGISWQAIFKIGALKNFAAFTGKHLCWSLILVKLLAWFGATLLKRDSHTGVFQWNLLIFKNTFFLQNTSSGSFCVYQVDNALWMKLISTDFGTDIFLWILRNFLKHYWSCLVTASFCH